MQLSNTDSTQHASPKLQALKAVSSQLVNRHSGSGSGSGALVPQFDNDKNWHLPHKDEGALNLDKRICASEKKVQAWFPDQT